MLCAAPVAKADPRGDQAEDIAAFRQNFFDKDRSYPPSARAEAERRLASLEAKSGQLDAAAFVIELCRITALADNGHTTAFWPRAVGAPVAFQPFGEDFYVVRAEPGVQELLGAQLIAIDGHRMTELRAAERSLHGGEAALRDQRGASFLTRFDLLHSLGLIQQSDGAVYRLRLVDGRTVERKLDLTPASPNRVTLPRLETAAWAFQAPDQPFRWRDAPELDAIVVQLRTNLDGKDQKIADFLAEAEAGRAEFGRHNVVLDMRWNSGGNFLLTRDFLLAWPSKAPGRFYVLESPVTFSAGIAGIAFLKQSGGARVTLMGEPVGDRLNFFAEGSGQSLPHSKLEVHPATMRDDFATGCRSFVDCFPAIAQPGSKTGAAADVEAQLDKNYGRVPLAVATLAPDVKAPLTIADYLSGHDSGMEAVARLIRR